MTGNDYKFDFEHMIQTHLLPLQPPFNYIYYGGIVGKQIATMVAAVDKTNADTPFANGYLKLEKEADNLLCHMYDEGTNLQVIAAELGRSEVAIKRRLKRLRKINDPLYA